LDWKRITFAGALALSLAVTVAILGAVSTPAGYRERSNRVPQAETPALQVALALGTPQAPTPEPPTSTPTATDLPPTPTLTAASPTQTPTPAATPTAQLTATPSPSATPASVGALAFRATYAAQCKAILNVPALPQFRNLSCEAAATRMVLAARSIEAAEDEILARMGQDPNPHAGFRGNVNGWGHAAGLPDYGTYAEVVARVLASYGVPGRAGTGLDETQVRQAVLSGQAVIVWMSYTASPRVIDRDGYRLVEGEHVLVVVGVGNDGRMLVHDPWAARAGGGYGTYFLARIPNGALFDRLAVTVPLS
jgi:uncharacterized protein YvpB